MAKEVATHQARTKRGIPSIILGQRGITFQSNWDKI